MLIASLFYWKISLFPEKSTIAKGLATMTWNRCCATARSSCPYRNGSPHGKRPSVCHF